MKLKKVKFFHDIIVLFIYLFGGFLPSSFSIGAIHLQIIMYPYYLTLHLKNWPYLKRGLGLALGGQSMPLLTALSLFRVRIGYTQQFYGA